MFTLRPYQEEMIELGINHLRHPSKKPAIIQAATGAGKSIVVAGMAHGIDEPTIILQPSVELLHQNHAKMLAYGIEDVAIHSASAGKKELGKYVMATIGSVYKKPELFKDYKHVIMDECHLLDPQKGDGMLLSFLKAIDCQSVIGLTATPYRIVQKFYVENGQRFYTAHLRMVNRIHPFFWGNIIYKIETKELIEQGYLSPIKYFIDRVDTSGLVVNSTGRDFTTESLERFWDDNKLRRIAQAVEYADTHSTKSLVFCSSIRQATNALKLVEGLGITAKLVTGETPAKDRLQLVEDYKAGKYKHLFNVGVFTTGFDVPDLDCIIMARPTMSLALWYQIVGRGVRLDSTRPEKVLQVFDLAGVAEKLGRVEEIRITKEAGGFREEVWSDGKRMDDKPLFNWLVKK